MSFEHQDVKLDITSPDDDVQLDKTYKYLVMNTDYTSRIIGEKMKKLKEEIKGMGYDASIMFIHDDIWGKGLYCKESRIEEVKSFNTSHKIVSGVIVLESEEGMNLGSWLSVSRIVTDLDYWHNCGLCYVEMTDDALYLDYDTESG
jgi:hypothetical protein